MAADIDALADYDQSESPFVRSLAPLADLLVPGSPHLYNVKALL